MNLNNFDINNHLSIAKKWRKQQIENGNKNRAETGVVMIFDGQVYCWKNKLRNPEDELPGVIAIDIKDNVFVVSSNKFCLVN